jgi:hypothetical protein
VFSKQDKSDADPDAAFAERLISLRPIYSPTESAQAERAVLEVEDLSLRPDNPYLASSLVPPTEKRSGSRIFFWAIPFVALAGLGGWLLAAQQAAPQAAAKPVARLVSKPAPAGPVASAVPAAPRVPVETPPVAVAAEPAAPAPSTPEAVEPVTPRVRATPVAREVAPSAPSGAPRPALTPAAAVTAIPIAPVADLPLTPSREQVAAGFEAVRAQLTQCAAGQHGVAQIAATIASTGRISHALVEGAFAGTPEGSCMARAVRAARFPTFSQPSLKVSYPVSL